MEEPRFEKAQEALQNTAISNPQSTEGEVEAIQSVSALEFSTAKKNLVADTLLGLICALAVLLFLGSQIISQLQVQSSLVWQLRSCNRQIEALEREIAEIQENDLASGRFLERAEKVSETYNALFADLLTLSESDLDAQAIVAKYQIRNLDKRDSK